MKTKLEGIRAMEELSREIVEPEFAIEIVESFGLDKSLVEPQHFDAKKDRITPYTSLEFDGVSIDDLSIKIVQAFGLEAVTYGGFLGAGRNAEAVTLRNCHALRKHFGFELTKIDGLVRTR